MLFRLAPGWVVPIVAATATTMAIMTTWVTIAPSAVSRRAARKAVRMCEVRRQIRLRHAARPSERSAEAPLMDDDRTQLS